MEIWGGAMQSVTLDDSYPEIGLRCITLDNLTIRHYQQRGIFMGGHNIHYVFIKNCLIRDSVFEGPETHGIYLSGGHWRDDYPPCSNIHVDNTTSCYSMGRHGIQFNGRFEYCSIKNSSFFHNEFAGISLIGCRDSEVKNNVIYGNNRQGIVLYDYDHNRFARHAMTGITIQNNTVVVGPHQWKKDNWHNNKPDNQPALLVNSNLGAIDPSFKPDGIHVRENIFVTPSDKSFEFYHDHDALAVRTLKNMFWAGPGANPSVHLKGKVYPLSTLENTAPLHYKDNTIEDPEFTQSPKYEFVDLSSSPTPYNFDDHKSEADLYSKTGTSEGVGAPLVPPPPPIQPVEPGEPHDPERPCEEAGPWGNERKPGHGHSGESEFPLGWQT